MDTEVSSESDPSSQDELLSRTLTHDELDDLTDSDSAPVAVTFATQDFDVSGLVQRLNRESLLIPKFGTTDERISTAGFQRGFVWNKAQMDRFIESLLLGYPVPGIFFVKQTTDNRMLVLDGQQRLVTLQRYYNGIHAGREFSLDNVGKEFKGLTYKSMDERLRFKLDDAYLQATIVSADGSAEVNEAVYQIFERLNAGGTQLTPHEIRVALYAGELIAYLETLNQQRAWRLLYGKSSPRIRDQELVLRILALHLEGAKYSRPLKTFLNTFVSEHRALDDSVREAGALFERACDALAVIGPSALRRPGGTQVNVAQAEAIIVGLMHTIAAGETVADLGTRIESLIQNEEFVVATTRATADKDAVTARVQLAEAAFFAK